MKIRFRNLAIDDQAHKADLMAAVSRVLDHGQLIAGPEIERFEEAFASRCNQKHCVAVGSGTSALYLALRAIDIGPGDEVITTPLSWISTLQAIMATGATPVFADIGDDLNMDAEKVEALVTPFTRAIVPVHFNGRLCNMKTLGEVSQRRELAIIEDAAQAFGARANGQVAGSFGTIAAFSLNPMKNPAGFGEAGAIVMDSEELRDRLRRLRQVGMEAGEVCVEPSLNFKMDALQAALIGVNLKRTEEITKRRLEVALRYTEALAGLVKCPAVEDDQDRPSVFFDYTILTEQRDDLMAHLEGCGIEVKIKHTPLMPDQPAFRNTLQAEVPNAHHLVDKILCLPIHEKLTDQEISYVIDVIRGFFSA